jgi:hypothetical protein
MKALGEVGTELVETRARLRAAEQLLQRVYDHSAGITAGGLQANRDSEIAGYRLDESVYQDIETFLYPNEEVKK